MTSATPAVLRIGAVLVFIILLLCLPVSSAVCQEPSADNDPVAFFNAGQEQHEKGDLPTAIKLYSRAIELRPEFPEAEYQKGMAFLALGDKANAETSFRNAVRLRADWTIAMTRLGSLLVALDKLEEAEPILSRSLTLDPKDTGALSALVDLKLRKRASISELRELYTLVSGRTGQSASAALFSARAALETTLGDHAGAKQSIQAALKLDPNFRPALIQAADIALAEGDLKTAKANLAHLEASGSDTDELKLLRANLYAAEGKVTEAMAELEKISAKSIAAETLRSRIAAVTATNAAELESRLAAAPNDPAVLGRLCTLYRREQPQKALTYCRRAAEAQPDNVNHVVGYAAALVQARQFEAAASILRKVVEKIPDNSVAHANLATALFQLKLYPDARAEFLWLSRDQPQSAGPYLFLGIISDELGEYSDALAYYRKYVGIADPLTNKTDIEKVNLRIPALVKLVKEGKNGKSGHR